VDIISRKVYVQEDETLNAATTIEFLQMLEKAYPNARKVHLFCDNARYYRNKSVQEYVTSSKLKMHFLPPYSPNLNPIERLWKFANERVLYNQYYEKFRDFKETLMSFFESLLDPPENILKALIRRVTDNFRPVNASTI
jgi:transposase